MTNNNNNNNNNTLVCKIICQKDYTVWHDLIRNPYWLTRRSLMKIILVDKKMNSCGKEAILIVKKYI